MILTLGIVILILIILLWITSIYFSWKINNGYIPRTLTKESVLSTTDKSFRLGRRGWYVIILNLKKVYLWVQVRVRKVFVTIVPSAKIAFVEKDELAGLTHGPSSFFLKEIADAKNGLKKHLSKGKKML